VDEEPHEHLQMGLLAAERQAFPDQVGDPKAQGGIEPFDVLGAPDDVQRVEDHAGIHLETIGMTPRFEVRRGQAVPQAPGAFKVPVSDETADDLAAQAVHREPDPALLCLLGHKGAYLIALQHQRRWCWSAHVFDDTTSNGSMRCGTLLTRVFRCLRNQERLTPTTRQIPRWEIRSDNIRSTRATVSGEIGGRVWSSVNWYLQIRHR